MNNEKNLLDHILRHKHLLVTATAVLVLFGIAALFNMPRDEFPEFTIREGLVIGTYPGASSTQVEEQLTKKVENYLFQYEEIDKEDTYSVSSENLMVVYVDVRDSESESERNAFWAKLRHGLNELKMELPPGVMALYANEDFGNTSALLVGVESDTRTYRELERLVENFEDDIRRIPATSRVKRLGMQKEIINVYIDDATLTQYGIDPMTVYHALNPESQVNFSGELDDGEYIKPIHIPTSYHTESDIANRIVHASPHGNVIRVKDVARVVREYDKPDSFIRLNGKKCLIVSLEMLPGNNIVQYGKDVNLMIDKFSREVPSDVRVGIISDMPRFVSHAVGNFLLEFLIAIVAVIIVTMMLLPLRVAAVAASAIPISIMATMGALWATGFSLQNVSLAALIVVLGMVVDNAIVIVDNYVEKLDHDISPREAAASSVTDLFGSVFSATLIIVCCFIPIPIFQKGIASDFTFSLPYAIGYALFISLFVSAFLIPLLSYIFIKAGIKEGNMGKRGAFLRWLQKKYDLLIEKSFRAKGAIVALSVLSLVLGIAILTQVKQKAFPYFERNQFAVEVYLPTGSSLEQTNLVMEEIEDLLLNDERVEEVASFVGASSPRFNTLYAPNLAAKHYGQLLVITKSPKATEEILDDYTGTHSDRNPRAFVKWRQLAMTLAKAPIEVRISGDSIATIKAVSDTISAILRKMPGVDWIRTDYKQPLQAVSLEVQHNEATRMGFTKTILGNTIMLGTEGFPVATLWEDDYALDVNLKIDDGSRKSVTEVLDQYASSPFTHASVPLRQLVTAEPDWTEGEIVRRNGRRTITVKAEVDRSHFSSDILSEVKPIVDKLELPEGVSIAYGGDYEENKKYMTPLYYSLSVSVVTIFFILLAQFRRIKTALLIMTTILLSIFGAALGLLVMGYPVGVTAFVGLIGLIGIIIRNGIIYVSYAEELRVEHGYTLAEAALAGAKRRMRPIFLTASAAAVGVIPMITSGSFLWGPLGTVICFGLIFGMVLSLTVIPILYYIIHRDDEKKTREVVEA